MGGSSKTATTTQQVQIPPEVMARYSAVNRRAEAAAAQPFKPYSSDPNAFVAPLTGAQQAGIQNIGMAQNIAQPYYQMGTGLTLAGARGVGPLTQGQIGYYENPYTQAVAGTTFDALRQQQQQEMQGATANAIRSGAFGGDRSGLVAANLARQQQLGTAQAMAPIYERGYAQALQTAQGQQGVQAQDLQRQLAAGQQLAGLGTGASQTALQAGQALLGAGTAEQQTQQAGLSALYNQFLQERGYPFQVAQFLANIAMGTGALSGSTTTTQQPVPFFSDEREKTNIQPLGKGLYAYDYIDDVEAAERGERPMPPKRVGPMAQDIEERAPGLVGEVGGHKVVKGLAPESMGGAVVDLMPGEYRSGYAPGGLVGSDDIRAILEAQKQAFAPFAQAGLYGGNPQQGGVGKPGYVPGGMLPTPKLMTAGPAPRMPESTVSQAMNTASQFGLKPSSLYDMGRKGLGTVADLLKERGPSIDETSATQGTPDVGAPMDIFGSLFRASGGLVGYAEGGGVDKDDPMASYGPQGPGIDIPTEQPDIKPLEPAKPPSSQPNSVMGDVLGLAKTAASIYTGMPFASGGLVPRMGYAEGGSPEEIDLDRAAAAIRARESSDRYNITGPVTRRRDGTEDRPYGAYQVMGSNIGPWTEEALGRRLSPQEFLADREAQDAVFRHHFGKAAQRYGTLEDAASVWFSGRPLSRAGNSRDVLGTSVPDYVRDIRMAYAGDRANLPAERAIENAAGRPQGLGNAAPAREPERTGLAAMLPTKFGTRTVQTPKGEQFSGLGEFLTSRQFVQPLLEGIGAMASSQSLNPWGAALQGLGAASRAYTGLEKEMAGVGETTERAGLAAAEARETSARTTRANVVTLPNGEIRIFYYDPVTGEQKQMRDYEYWSIDPDKRPAIDAASLRLLESRKNEPSVQAGIRQGALQQAQTSRLPTDPTQPPPGQKEPVERETTIPFSDPSKWGSRGEFTIGVSPQAREMARIEQERFRALETVQGRTDTANNIKKIRENAENAIRVADSTTQQLNNLARPASGLIATGNWQTGPLSTGIMSALGVVNQIIGGAIGEEYKINPRAQTDYELMRKEIANLRATKAEALGERAVSALQKMEEGLADPSKAPDAIAEIIAKGYIEKQRGLDEGVFTLKYSRLMGPTPVGERAREAFTSQVDEKDYEADAAAIKKLLMTPFGPNSEPMILYATGKGKDSELQKRINANPNVINQYFGRNVMRYFQRDLTR